jgi:hypothetical protein
MMEKVDEIAADLLAAGLIEDLLEDEPFPNTAGAFSKGLSDADFLKWGRGWRDRKRGIFELMSNPKILDAVESLIGPKSSLIRFIMCGPRFPVWRLAPCRGIRTSRMARCERQSRHHGWIPSSIPPMKMGACISFPAPIKSAPSRTARVL